jgi:hypothetical protein
LEEFNARQLQTRDKTGCCRAQDDGELAMNLAFFNGQEGTALSPCWTPEWSA